MIIFLSYHSINCHYQLLYKPLYKGVLITKRMGLLAGAWLTFNWIRTKQQHFAVNSWDPASTRLTGLRVKLDLIDYFSSVFACGLRAPSSSEAQSLSFIGSEAIFLGTWMNAILAECMLLWGFNRKKNLSHVAFPSNSLQIIPTWVW